MKIITYSFAALLLFVASCNTFKTATGAKLKAVTITDPGELFSTYDLASSEAGTAAVNALTTVSADEKADIYKYSQEEQWPDGMATLDNRLKNREEIKKYNTYFLTSFQSGDRTINILKVPVSKNGHMKGAMTLDHDIYIVITSKGIKK